MAKMRNGKFSGTIGGEVYVNTKHGQVVRSRSRRRWRPSEARSRVMAIMSSVRGIWRNRTAKMDKSWRAAGKKVNLSGYNFSCKINCALLDAGLPPVMDPPKPEKIRPNPVGRLDIRNRDGVITLRLKVPRAPAKYTFVRSWKPVSAGRSFWSTFATIGLLPPGVRDWSDITSLYVKRFGVPPLGSRIFVQTWQLINGWQDDFKDTNAVVPPA